MQVHFAVTNVFVLLLVCSSHIAEIRQYCALWRWLPGLADLLPILYNTLRN